MKREDIRAMSATQRKQLLDDVAALVHSGEWRFGEATRFLRAVVLGRTRQSFATLVGISLAALKRIEDSDANPTLDTLNRVFRPFGATIGLVFPRMNPSPPATDEVEQRRASLRLALAETKRARSAD